ncbi:hotdog family protein [Halomonas ramblicola]|uniref:hotdog family protein n=1 Tax=Halomonas ramblicola TaxID=747349 RepID=UPI0025B373FB|nr:hotdog family protein [Halomonas ramblicola]MDN3521797.1 hotdog family protein [Halomonas ramblicola]
MSPIADLVPHRGPMCLLDGLVEAGEEHLIAEVTPRRDDLFASAEGIPAWVGIEWLAQAIAAWSGRRALAAGGTPRIGFLLGSRRYRCRVAHFAFDRPVRVEITLDYLADNGLGAFRGCLRSQEGAPLAEATLNAFEPDSPETLAAMQEDSRS